MIDRERYNPSNAKNSQIKRAHILMLIATGLVATSFPVGAAITNELNSLVLTFLRFTLAAVLFAPIIVWRYGIVIPSRWDLARYGVLSACLVGFFWAMFTALQLTSTLNTAAIFALTPVIAAAASSVLLKEKLNKVSRVALPLGVMGAIWVVFRGNLEALLSLKIGLGDIIFFVGTVALGLYGPLVKYFHRGEPMAQMTFWTLVTGASWLFVLSVPLLVEVEWSMVPLKVYGGIIYLATFTTLVTFFVFQWSTTTIGPIKTTSYIFLNPSLVLVIGMMLGREAPTLSIYPGLILTFLATLVLQWSRPVAV